MPQLHTVYLSEEPHARFLARCQAFPERSTSEHLDEVVTAGLAALEANGKPANGTPAPKKPAGKGKR
jgi:hypothetical protein